MSSQGVLALAGINITGDGYPSIEFAGDGKAIFYNKQTTLADDATFPMPKSGEGFILAMAEDDESIVVQVEAAGTLKSLAGTTNTATTDSDTNFCVFDNSGTVTVKNRLGAQKVVTIFALLM